MITGVSAYYIKQFQNLFNGFLNSKPTIKGFESIFQMIIESKWQQYKNDNVEEYFNIFGKICSELQNDSKFEYAIYKLKFLEEMKNILETKYDILYSAMLEYFKIYHSNVPNKIDKIQSSKDIISKLSALYIAKSKEKYKKECLSDYFSLISSYYKLRIKHPDVKQKIIYEKQKKLFQNLYLLKDEEIMIFINKIIDKYSTSNSRDIIEYMIDSFIVKESSKLSEFMSMPLRYNEYERFKKITKLINRLNSGYIKFDGLEVANYKDLIKLDETSQKYIYMGNNFTGVELSEFNKYKGYEQVFSKIKNDIMTKVKTIEVDVEIDDYENIKLTNYFPFNDEYFEFDLKNVLMKFCFWQLHDMSLYDFRKCNPQSFIKNESYNAIYNYLVNSGIMWLNIILDDSYINAGDFRKNGIYIDDIVELIDNMPNIIKLTETFPIDINNIKELINLHSISKNADVRQIVILGENVLKNLIQSQSYTPRSEKRLISVASELICKMSIRSKSTVPYINGETENYKYSMYDHLDETILLSGINTDACFKILGIDNDFLHYCALNKNGFVIKITDYNDNFIARASGFRNGNAVYINQLRTIYDKTGNSYNSKYINEQNDIIDTFKKACDDIVSISQNNIDEENKIDFVFVTKSYTLKDYKNRISRDLEEIIGGTPMDNQSKDWMNYIKNTNNLKESKIYNYFETDYCNYSIICMASNKKISNINPKDIIKGDVPALYERSRTKVSVTTSLDDTLYRKINKVKAINSFFNNTSFEMVEIPQDSIIFTGDNWYLIYHNQKIINYCILDHDEKANLEFKNTLETINNSKENNQINKLQIVNNQLSIPHNHTKILKKVNN